VTGEIDKHAAGPSVIVFSLFLPFLSFLSSLAWIRRGMMRGRLPVRGALSFVSLFALFSAPPLSFFSSPSFPPGFAGESAKTD